MYRKPPLIAMDLEGVLVPEIWIAVAEKTGIEKLRLTTRDVADYDVLMQGRLQILRNHKLSLPAIQTVIESIEPLAGAVEFLQWIRQRAQAVVLTDSYYEFVAPLMVKLGFPTHFCNTLEVDDEKMIIDYHLRIPNGKKNAVASFKELGFYVVAIGDSYNDTAMLAEADAGVLFRPSQNVIADFPQFRVTHSYEELQDAIDLGPGTRDR